MARKAVGRRPILTCPQWWESRLTKMQRKEEEETCNCGEQHQQQEPQQQAGIYVIKKERDGTGYG